MNLTGTVLHGRCGRRRSSGIPVWARIRSRGRRGRALEVLREGQLGGDFGRLELAVCELPVLGLVESFEDVLRLQWVFVLELFPFGVNMADGADDFP